MIYSEFKKMVRGMVLVLTVLILLTAPSFGATVNLVAEEAETIMPDGVTVPMWGFFADTGQACNPVTAPAWDVGPQIVIPPGDATLTINLRNCLDSAATSVIIPGQGLPVDSGGNILAPVTMTDAQGRVRVTSFTSDTPSGGSGIYIWNNIKVGTYLYQSGSHPALQVHMGLYGAMTGNSAVGEAYPGVGYDHEVVILYSEIDPAKHSPPTTPKPLDYRPKYFLVNGQPYQGGPPMAAGGIQQTTLLRFLNSGLKDHAPNISSGHFSVVSENGSPYPYAREQYGLQLAAGKTMDVLFTPETTGNFSVYDRRLHLTTGGVTNGGQLAVLNVVDVAGVPVADAGPDQVGVPVGSLAVLDGTASYDPDSAPNPLLTYAWNIASAPVGSAALIVDATVANPQFTPDIPGTYSVDLVVNDGATDSAPDSVMVTTNLPPVADAGPDSLVAIGSLVTIDGSGSSDPDNGPNPLSYTWTIVAAPIGSTVAFADPTAVSQTFTADLGGFYTFALVVNDGLVNSATDVVNVTAAVPPNQPPVAADDGASTPRNTPVTIVLIANDSDPDGTLDPASVVITNQPTRGGNAQNMLNGTVIYTPRRGFAGTDTFTYTINDNDGATSNEATVRVNVVK